MANLLLLRPHGTLDYGQSVRNHPGRCVLRWANAEGVPEAVIAAICLLGEKSVDDIVARLSTAELDQVTDIVERSPSCYPPGVYTALKDKRDLVSTPQQADGAPPKGSAKKAAYVLAQKSGQRAR